jgi:hypothetical protein
MNDIERLHAFPQPLTDADGNLKNTADLGKYHRVAYGVLRMASRAVPAAFGGHHRHCS